MELNGQDLTNQKQIIMLENEHGNGYIGNIPNIIDVLKNEIEQKTVELKNKGYSKITVFDYIKPCTYMYDWNYIDKNKIN